MLVAVDGDGDDFLLLNKKNTFLLHGKKAHGPRLTTDLSIMGGGSGGGGSGGAAAAVGSRNEGFRVPWLSIRISQL